MRAGGTINPDQRLGGKPDVGAWIFVTRNDEEEMFSRIEAEQKLINRLIEDSKRLSERSDVLMRAARRPDKSSQTDEGDARASS